MLWAIVCLLTSKIMAEWMGKFTHVVAKLLRSVYCLDKWEMSYSVMGSRMDWKYKENSQRKHCFLHYWMFRSIPRRPKNKWCVCSYFLYILVYRDFIGKRLNGKNKSPVFLLLQYFNFNWFMQGLLGYLFTLQFNQNLFRIIVYVGFTKMSYIFRDDEDDA